MGATVDGGLSELDDQHVPCLVEILEQFGWRINNIRGRLSRTKQRIRLGKTNQQNATTLELEGDHKNLQVEHHRFETLMNVSVDWQQLRTGLSSSEQFQVGLTALKAEVEKFEADCQRYQDLLDDCVDWICRRTGLLSTQILAVAFKQGFENEPLNIEGRALAELDRRGETADLWRALLSNDRDALVSVNLLRSRELMPPPGENLIEPLKILQQATEAAGNGGGKAGSRVNVPNDLEKRVESLESRTTKPPTKTEVIRNQRIKFCCPKRRKKSPDTWNEIYDAYHKKFPNDKKASPDTLLHSHDRNCLKCREQKS